MKNRMLICGIIFAAAASFLAFDTATTVPAITGKITPADGAEVVWAVSGKDSVKVSPVMGAFTIEVKPGSYSVIVDAKPPYKDAQIDNVQVTAGQTVDVGDIVLQQ